MKQHNGSDHRVRTIDLPFQNHAQAGLRVHRIVFRRFQSIFACSVFQFSFYLWIPCWMMQMKVIAISKEMPYAIGVSEARDSIPNKQFSIFEFFVGRYSVFILKRDRTLNFRSTNSLSPWDCLLYTSPSPRDATLSRMPSSA